MRATSYCLRRHSTCSSTWTLRRKCAIHFFPGSPLHSIASCKGLASPPISSLSSSSFLYSSSSSISSYPPLPPLLLLPLPFLPLLLSPLLPPSLPFPFPPPLRKHQQISNDWKQRLHRTFFGPR